MFNGIVYRAKINIFTISKQYFVGRAIIIIRNYVKNDKFHIISFWNIIKVKAKL